MTENPLDEMFDDFAARTAAGLDTEHEIVDAPACSAKMRRTCFGGVEELWVNGYPRAQLIVVTVLPAALRDGGEMVGVVRDIPVGWRQLASPEAFRAMFDSVVRSYEHEAWKQVEA